MFLLMTYNFWIFLAVLFGNIVGYFFFGSKLSVSNVTSTDTYTSYKSEKQNVF